MVGSGLMEVQFRTKALERLETDPDYTGGYDKAIVTMYRKRLWVIRGAPDERVFYAMKSLHFEKLKGNRSHQFSMRLNDQWRLILEFEGKAQSKTTVIVSIEDYH